MFRAAATGPACSRAIFFLGYGTFRFICEFFREPDAPFLGRSAWAWRCRFPIWLAAGALFAVALRKPQTRHERAGRRASPP